MNAIRKNAFLLLLFSPIAIYFIVFKYVPMLGLVIAFKDYNFMDGISGSPWVGLDNFRALFANPQMVIIIKNTFVLSILNIVIGFPFPILLAILLNEVRSLWFKKSIQTIVYLPHFLSWVIIGGMVVTIFSQDSGIVNDFIKKFGGEPYPFLYKEGSWIALFVGSNIWKEMGFSAIIYLAALSSIDPQLYEAASLDGAGKLRKMWHVTLPAIVPTMVIMLILGLGKAMEVGFDQAFVLQNPVVSGVAEVISTFIYRMGLQGMQFSMTTALGLFDSAIGLVLVLSANYISRKFGQGLW
ncbi:ABC transporter permease [Paenibacillus piri]|uniref:Sugar ABC transporter permease n=1 Tax=Paenibacillus piri TaxID=2547395 RepID=A0A4R5KY01_9BACL|nr:ABC transporter permease subunit [Paenibacillus piri]TDG00944.1 sugar ABC transporter permease [Paenibacillus piri]